VARDRSLLGGPVVKLVLEPAFGRTRGPGHDKLLNDRWAIEYRLNLKRFGSKSHPLQKSVIAGPRVPAAHEHHYRSCSWMAATGAAKTKEGSI